MPTTQYSEGGVPNENIIVNPLGSLTPYLTGEDAKVTSLLQENIIRKIFSTRPQKYTAALDALLFKRVPTFFKGEEAQWFEMPDQRQALVVDDGSSAAGAVVHAATDAVSGDYATVNMPVGAASFAAAGINRRLYFNGGGAVIVGKTPGTPNTLQLKALGAGKGIPAIIQGKAIPQSAEIRADGERRIVNHQRYSTIKRTNFITTIMNSREYGRKAYLTMTNGGTTDFMPRSMEQLVWDTRADAMLEIIRGQKGIQQNDDGKLTRTTDGLEAQLAAVGNNPIQCTVGSFVPTFEDVLHDSAYNSTNTKLVMAHSRVHTELSKQYKSDLTRYSPNDMVANLNLKSIVVGSTTAVLLPCDILGDVNYFGEDGGKRVYVIEEDAIHMAGMEGMPYIDVNKMVSKKLLSFTDNPGSRDDLITNPVEMTFAPMVVGPERCKMLDVDGIL
jgi:hypothetical protein